MKQKICIVGDGLTGLTTAIVLGKLNIKVELIAPNFKKRTNDKRTTAISQSNYNFLIEFLGKNIENLFWPCKKIDLYHETSNINKNFMSFEDQGRNLMYVIENKKLKNFLKKEINKNNNIKIINKKMKRIDARTSQVFFEKKRQFYDLIFLCVGKKSNMIDNLIGKRYVQNDTKEVAITTVVKHKQKILNARQYFFKEGPLAILPLSNNSFSLVWSLNRNFDIKNIGDLITKKLRTILNKSKRFNFSKIHSFPISLRFNVNSKKNNILVLGEGSHNIHPIAGQGYNLILRDIKALHNEIQNFLSIGMQLKESQILNNFVNTRKPENFIFGFGIDLINRFFNENKIPVSFRSVILKDIDQFKFLKKLSLNLSNRGIFN